MYCISMYVYIHVHVHVYYEIVCVSKRRQGKLDQSMGQAEEVYNNIVIASMV